MLPIIETFNLKTLVLWQQFLLVSTLISSAPTSILDLDFGIDLPDDVIEQIERKYKKALEESGMDDDDFGPTYYEQLKKEDKELADKIEEAAWDTLYYLLEHDDEGDDYRVEAMQRVYEQDEEGNWYQTYAIGNKFDFDLADFPRYHNYNPSNH